MTALPGEVDEHLTQCRVVRVAAQLPSGLPLVVPLWFVRRQGRFCLTQRDGSPLVRAVSSRPEVLLLFDPDGAVGERRVLRVRGRARVVHHRSALLRILPRQAARYHLNPGALRGYVRHPRSVAPITRYYIERARRSAVVEIDVLGTEFVLAPRTSC